MDNNDNKNDKRTNLANKKGLLIVYSQSVS